MKDITNKDSQTVAADKIMAFMNELENDFVNSLGGNKVDFRQECHFAMQALLNNSYLLDTAKAAPQSLRNALINLAAIGITLNPASQLAYLVPRKIRKSDPSAVVCLDISYKGMIRTATDAGSILWAQSEVVYEGENFEMNTVGDKPLHRFNPFSRAKDGKKVIGAYAIVKTFEGDYLTCAMSIDEINEIRNRSMMSASGPWKDFTNEMMKKTVIKRAAKMWPRTNKIHLLEKAIDIVNEHEGIEFNDQKSIADEVEEDFPRSELDKTFGPDYLVTKGKFRNLRLKEIDVAEIEEHLDDIDKKNANGVLTYRGKYWMEIRSAYKDYIENYQTYQDILNEDVPLITSQDVKFE
jgi:recombination protein RecT